MSCTHQFKNGSENTCDFEGHFFLPCILNFSGAASQDDWLLADYRLSVDRLPKKVLMHLPCVWETMCHSEPGEVCVPFMPSQRAFNKLMRCINQVFEVSLQKTLHMMSQNHHQQPAKKKNRSTNNDTHLLRSRSRAKPSNRAAAASHLDLWCMQAC